MSSSKKEPILKDQIWSFIKKQLITVLKYAGLYSIALIYWELLLRTQTGFDNFSLYFLLFLPAESLFLATLTGWLKPKFNRWLTPAIMLLPFAFYVSQLIYFRIFGSMFSVSMMGLGADAVGNFGWALWSTVKESVGWIILCLLPVVAAVLLSFLAPKGFYKRFKPISHLGSFVLTIATWFLAVLLLLPFGTDDASPYAAYSSAYIDTDTAADRLGVMTNTLVELRYVIFGAEAETDNTLTNPDVQPPVLDTEVDNEPEFDTSPNILNGIDFNTLKESTTDKGKQELCDYFNGVTATNKNAYTGILKDYNLIYICAESFSNYAIDPAVTPTLFRMSCGGIVLNNYYNSFKNTTTNGEFVFMTGLWPDVSRQADAGTTVGSFAQSVNKDIPFALGNMFESNGIKSYAYHNYRGYYYSRNRTHPNLGYTTTRFMGGENGMTFTSSWPSSDLEMMQQSIDDFINEEQFHTYYMTFSGHGPYSTANPIAVKNIEKVRELLGDRKLTKNAEYYLAANYELELAMQYLFQRLEEAGKLQNTLIVLTGDHYPYYLNDDALESLAGGEVEENFDKYHSSCIMWCGGLPTTKVDTYYCNVDILPTVLNLFGMEYDSRLLPGIDIFATNTTHMATLYNKSFITEYVRYNSQDGKAEWTAAASKLSDEQKQQYLDYCIAVTKSKYTVSLKLMEENFYKFVTDSIVVNDQQAEIQ